MSILLNTESKKVCQSLTNLPGSFLKTKGFHVAMHGYVAHRIGMRFRVTKIERLEAGEIPATFLKNS